MPNIFGLRVITYWQALGLMVLSWILFGGLRGRSGHGPWRYGMRWRWERMTPAEREEFVKGLRSRCGGMSPPELTPRTEFVVFFVWEEELLSEGGPAAAQPADSAPGGKEQQGGKEQPAPKG